MGNSSHRLCSGIDLYMSRSTLFSSVFAFILPIGVMVVSNYAIAGNSCESLFSKYSTPASFRLGLDLAEKAIRAKQKNEYGPNSIWYDFAKKTRIQVNPGEAPIDVAFRLIKHKTRENIYRNDLLEDKQNYFVTTESVGLRSLNRLVSKRIAIVGIGEGQVDGRYMNYQQFAAHDIGHGEQLKAQTANQFNIGDSSIKSRYPSKIFQALDYDTQTKKMDEATQLFYDIGYFFHYHEGIMSSAFNYEIALYEKKMTPKKLKEIYGHLADGAQGLDVSFSTGAKPQIRVSIKKSNTHSDSPYHVHNRLLNKNDFWDILPPEIQNKAIQNPEQAQQIAADFISEALSMFYQNHFLASSQILVH